MPAANLVTGVQRALPRNLIGLNSPVTYDIPHEDAALAPAVKAIAPGLLRFPGGTVGNFFNWRTGQLDVPEAAGASGYRTFLRRMQPVTHRMHPDGITMEQWTEFAEAVGAEITLVVNLESATVDDQREWFESMAASGVVPTRIEMGNEFYLALLGDARSHARFPDWETTLAITDEYTEAIRPYLPPGAKIGVQCAASRLFVGADPGTGRIHDEWVWDDSMAPEPWFDAVIVHPYPELDVVAGRGSFDSLPAGAERVLPPLLAKVDDGYRRVFEFVEERMPGKEIWVTEWGAGVVGPLLTGKRPRFNAFWLHVVARGILSMLRHESVTAMQYHGLFCNGGVYAVLKRLPAGGYEPVGPAELLRWFHEAANAGADYQRVVVEGAVPLRAGAMDESYLEVEGALFDTDEGRTLIIQNAGRDDVVVDVGPVGSGVPTEVEVMTTPDLGAVIDDRLPDIATISPAATLTLQGYSVTKAVWR